MFFISSFVILIQIITFVQSTPIINGEPTGVIQEIKTRHGKELMVRHNHDFPYMVYLEMVEDTNKGKNSYFCGGAIISQNAVLTAAHCVVGQDTKPRIYAWAGIIHLALERGFGQKKRVKEVKIHENFVSKCDINATFSDCLLNDIAILWVETPYELKNGIKNVEIIKKINKFENQEVLILGWGGTENIEPSKMLKKGTLKIISQQECQRYYNDVRITDNTVCAISSNKKTCTGIGDSGGPLIMHGELLGVSAFAHRKEFYKRNEIIVTCDPEKPAVFTLIPKYKKWIKQSLKRGPTQKKP